MRPSIADIAAAPLAITLKVLGAYGRFFAKTRKSGLPGDALTGAALLILTCPIYIVIHLWIAPDLHFIWAYLLAMFVAVVISQCAEESSQPDLPKNQSQTNA